MRRAIVTNQTDAAPTATVLIEPLLAKRLGTIAKLSNRNVDEVTNRALNEWMETTGDLLIEFATNRLPKQDDGAELDNLVLFAKPDNSRAVQIKKTHRHRPQCYIAQHTEHGVSSSTSTSASASPATKKAPGTVSARTARVLKSA